MSSPLSVKQACERLLECAAIDVSSEQVHLTQLLGRVLAEDVMAQIDVPMADNSAMDGYAFNYKQAKAQNFKLPVAKRIPAGSIAGSIETSAAARIFTGADIPQGADTVAMQEICEEVDGVVSIDPAIRAGVNIRKLGQDVKKNSVVLNRGDFLRAQEIGLLASIGIEKAIVYKRLRVGVLSTGDELVDIGQTLKSGQIYNSNRYMLLSLLESLNFQAEDLGCLPDQLEAIEECLNGAAKECDVVISSGGVSVGEEDHVKLAVENIGELDFWKVAVKPGKPLAFGYLYGADEKTKLKVPFFGLPGNPSSALITFLIFARLFLLASQGRSVSLPKESSAIALFDKKAESREVYLRARLTDKGVQIYDNQSSGMLSSACWADVLLIQPAGENIVSGEAVSVLHFASLLSGH